MIHFKKMLCLIFRCLPIVDVFGITVSGQYAHLALFSSLFKRKCFQHSDRFRWLTSSNPSSDIGSTDIGSSKIFDGDFVWQVLLVIMGLLNICRIASSEIVNNQLTCQIIMQCTHNVMEKDFMTTNYKKQHCQRLNQEMSRWCQEFKTTKLPATYVHFHLFHWLISAQRFHFNTVFGFEMSAHRRCESSKHFIAVFTLYSVEDFVHKKVLPDCRMSLLAHIFKSFQCHLNGEATTKSHSNAFITYKKNHSIFWEWWWWKVTLQRKCKKHSYTKILSRDDFYQQRTIRRKKMEW